MPRLRAAVPAPAAINLATKPVNVSLGAPGPRWVWLLTAAGAASAPAALLNGAPLPEALTPEVPPLPPAVAAAGAVELPARSYAFLLLPHAGHAAYGPRASRPAARALPQGSGHVLPGDLRYQLRDFRLARTLSSGHARA